MPTRRRSSEFWAEALGYVVQPPPPGFDTWEDLLREHKSPSPQWNAFSAVVDPDGVGPRLFFQQVPEPKQGKSRVHLDLNVGGGPGRPSPSGAGAWTRPWPGSSRWAPST